MTTEPAGDATVGNHYDKLMKQKSISQAAFTRTYNGIVRLMNLPQADFQSLNLALTDLQTKYELLEKKCEEILAETDIVNNDDIEKLLGEKYGMLNDCRIQINTLSRNDEQSLPVSEISSEVSQTNELIKSFQSIVTSSENKKRTNVNKK